MGHNPVATQELVRVDSVAVDRAVTMATHSHDRDQITLVIEGSLQVETSEGTWTVPSGEVVWVPHGVEHAERLHAGASLRLLHLDAGIGEGLPQRCHTLVATPLLRELILRVGELGGLDASVPEQARLAGVLLDEVRSQDEAPLKLPTPQDPRALQFARMVDEAPADRTSVSELARRAGTSRRTMERLFMADLGMSIGEWRHRLRLHQALRLLGEQHPVNEVARRSGYGSASAFITAFKRQFGVTPNRYRPQ